MFARSRIRKTDPARIHAHANFQGYLPADMRRLLGIPAAYTGKGQKIGIISLGGSFSQAEFDAARAKHGLPPKTVNVISVNGAQMQPDPGGANVENALDLQVSSGMAPDAAIDFYVCANTDADFAAGIAQLVADDCDAGSISWGAAEKQWGKAARDAMNAQLQAAVAKKISVSVAAGDNGSSDGGTGDNADFPGSSPYAVCCGGTRLNPDGSETVWNDGAGGGATGGGVSVFFAKPDYQASLPGSMRLVPDVAGNADPVTPWLVLSDGQWQQVGGTSAVAPMYAGLQACLNEAAGTRIGFLNPLAYANPSTFKDIVSGNNGDFSAGPGYDECTGLGSPNGPALFALVQQGPPPVPPDPTQAPVSPPASPVSPPTSPSPPPPPPPPAPKPPAPLTFYLALLDAKKDVIIAVPIHPTDLLRLLSPLKGLVMNTAHARSELQAKHGLSTDQLDKLDQLDQAHARIFGLPPGTLWNGFLQMAQSPLGKQILQQILSGILQQTGQPAPAAV